MSESRRSASRESTFVSRWPVHSLVADRYVYAHMYIYMHTRVRTHTSSRRTRAHDRCISFALWARLLSLDRGEAERSSAEPLGTGDCRLCFEEHALSAAAAGIFCNLRLPSDFQIGSAAGWSTGRPVIFSHVARRPRRASPARRPSLFSSVLFSGHVSEKYPGVSGRRRRGARVSLRRSSLAHGALTDIIARFSAIFSPRHASWLRRG